MSNRILLQPAFVLHRRPYSNTSWILELLTLNHGRISVLARSARGLKSRYKGKLELFFPLLVSWSGQRELKILGEVEVSSMPYLLNGKALLCGFYLNELLLRLLHREDAFPHLFNHYQETLQALSKDQNLSITLRRFEKNLLHHLGYGLPLQNDCITGLPIEIDKLYTYIPDQGFTTQFIKTNTIFSGKMLLALRDENFSDDASLQEAKLLTQLALNRLLGNKSLKSRELLQ